MTGEFHTCILRCVFSHVHAAAENGFESIFRSHRKSCETLLTDRNGRAFARPFLLLCKNIQMIVDDTGFAVFDADIIAQIDDTTVGDDVIE